MLFNSYTFLFVFLPVCIFGFLLTYKRSSQNKILFWLTACSLFFYSYEHPSYFFLIFFSIIFNYFVGSHLQDHANKKLLIIGIITNLMLLAYFKYMNFFTSEILSIFNNSNSIKLDIVLPIGISFYTFQSITYLVDSYKQLLKNKNFLRFALYITFFPQLIAGPIVHYSTVSKQFKSLKDNFHTENFIIGLTIFSFGLFKKVVIADTFGEKAHAFHQGVLLGSDPSFFTAWFGMFFYTIQIYFDFSGYSDMAVGLGRLFGIKLPINFWSPYKSTSIIDFWKRWHITLSTFLRDYLYIPLGGNRVGPIKRYLNLLITMLLGGLWHGAGWTFIIWGGLHGCYLMINHFFRYINIFKFIPLPKYISIRLGHILTFLAVIFAWVFFSAANVENAFSIANGMLGLNGIIIPSKIANLLGSNGEQIFALFFIKTQQYVEFVSKIKQPI
ncbi:hypothetical protein BVY03_03565 [bacterium K02(2017)]|nr:hypothetical protein BVY03_03565 [bacterium K02(2017)]